MDDLCDPARIDAWLYRLVVRASDRTGASRRRRASVVRILPDSRRLLQPGSERSSISQA